MADIIRVVIVEDEDLFRDLLASSLAGFPKISVVNAYRAGDEALRRFSDDTPDVVLLDINLGAGDTGVHIGLKMRQMDSDVGIVLLSNYDQPGVLRTITQSQAAGWSYLLKKSVANASIIVRAVEGARAGLMILDPHLVHAFQPTPAGLVAKLTPRQREVLGLMAQGYSNAGIAEKLVLQPKSVENTISQIYQGLGINALQGSIHARVKAALIFLNECTL